MNIHFLNLPETLQEGTKRAAALLGLSVCDSGAAVTVNSGDKIAVRKENGQIEITYRKKIHFFRALGLLAEHLKKGGDFYVEETPQLDSVGVMPDLSFGCPVTADELCRFMDQIAVMGINMLLLYIEDLYELPSRKYFGHMRGRYTDEEFRQMDDHAFSYGIELLPCMQTLGHLGKYMRWSEASDVKETDRELSVDKEASYQFIEEMIAQCSRHFRSKRIHIGMDEAWGLGRGTASLKQYGLRDQQTLFVEHLQKVVAITDRYGLTPMIWNDFVFCLNSESGINKYDQETEIPQQIMDAFPRNVQLVYWHYGEEVQGCDEWVIEKNLKFGNDVIFAGGLMMWDIPLPDNMFSYDASEEGLLASKKLGLREVFTTLWSYSGNGCNHDTSYLHLQQYAEHAYHETVSMEHLKTRFEACTGASFDAFWNMSQFSNIMDGREKAFSNYNERFHGQKIMWYDFFLGKYDDMLYKYPMSGHYAKMAEYYASLCAQNDRWFGLYDRCRMLFDFVGKKSYIAENLTAAYKNGNRDFLLRCTESLIPELLTSLDILHEQFRTMWFDTRKAFGWEDLDHRFGGMRARTVSAKRRIEDYLCGRIPKIEELEEPRLPMPESLWTTD